MKKFGISHCAKPRISPVFQLQNLGKRYLTHSIQGVSSIHFVTCPMKSCTAC
jgi:hypothetical protein